MLFIVLFLVTFSIRLIFSQCSIADPIKLNIGEIHTIFSQSLYEERQLNIYVAPFANQIKHVKLQSFHQSHWRLRCICSGLICKQTSDE
jgi:hypothetical protein